MAFTSWLSICSPKALFFKKMKATFIASRLSSCIARQNELPSFCMKKYCHSMGSSKGLLDSGIAERCPSAILVLLDCFNTYLDTQNTFLKKYFPPLLCS